MFYPLIFLPYLRNTLIRKKKASFYGLFIGGTFLPFEYDLG
jgi:hypothetical protein